MRSLNLAFAESVAKMMKPAKSSRVANLGDASAAARHALAKRWAGRGESATIRVDLDVATLVKALPERERRSHVSSVLRKALTRHA